MSTDYPAQILNHDGSEIELEGRINFTDPANAPGGSQPLQSGNGTPVGAVTPTGIGYVYIDLTNGGLWQAVGATNADWVAVGGIADALRNGDGTYGVGVSSTGHLLLIAPISQPVELMTADGMAGTGNAAAWHGPDGGEIFELNQGSSRQHQHLWDTDGTYHNANGIFFPTADPHIAGAWWDDAGTLTKSLG